MTDLGFGVARRLFGRVPLALDDLPPVLPADDPRIWGAVPPVDLPRAIAPLWFTAVATLLAHAVLSLAAPPLLRVAIAAVRDPAVPVGDGLWAAVGLAATAGAAWLLVSHGFVLCARVAMRIRASLTRALYDKLVRRKATGDEILNLVAVDVERVSWGAADLAALGMSLLSLGLGGALLFALLGPAAIASVAVLVLLSALSRRRADRLDAAADQAVSAADERLARLRDTLGGIRTVKLSSWEAVVRQRLAVPRQRELAATRRFAIHAAWIRALFLGSSVLLLAVTFGALAAVGRPLVAADAFATIALFGFLRPSLLFLPSLVTSVVGARVSMRRITKYLEGDEWPALQDQGPPGSVALSGACFAWADGQIALSDVALDIAPGELVVVTGPVGAGKTALLRAILGELDQTAGTRRRAGRVAVAGQEPFLVLGTVADNVVFGRRWDPERLTAALAAVGLDGDSLPASVGERGARLSGGQRQRVALARALYGDADLVVLDDPVSALDGTVADQVVERAVLGAWGAVTRIVATHSPALLARADRVVQVDGGRVSAGSSGAIPQRERKAIVAEVAAPQPEVAVPDEGGGTVPLSLYRDYLARLAPGPMLVGLAFLFAAREGFALSADYWLSWWSGREGGGVFVAGLAVFGGAAAAATWLRSVVLATRGVAVGRDLHDDAMKALLAAPLRVFETTPAGHLLQRLGRDQRVVDQELALVLLEAISTLALVLSTVLVVALATPLALVALPPALWLGARIAGRFRPTSRELRRFDAAAHTPLLAHLSQTVEGAPTIRAYRAQQAFGQRLSETLEPSQRAIVASSLLKGWLSVRLEGLGSVLAGVVAAVAVLSRDRLDPALAALALTHALLVTYTLGRWVRTWADLEGAMTSLQRLAELAALPAEETGPERAPPAGPGAVEFDRVDLRYADGAPLALCGVSFVAAPGERLGVVGRTGSGKSTLATALVRIVAAERGVIRLDGVDVRELPLAVLRSRITVVPQDPVLFEGSFRDNLDLAGAHTDEELIEALERVGLAVSLDWAVDSGGANLSAGQRQLSCLARGLLSGARVVVLDEATAHLDLETERSLRYALDHALAHATVITIAHRTETLADAARVLVMEGGRLRERPHPTVPLELA